MRRAIFAVVGSGLLACGGSGAERVEIDPPARPADPAPPPASAAAWGIRLERRCSSWRYVPLIADARHVWGCPGAVHDRATGELVATEEGGEPLVASGESTVWTIEHQRVVIRRGAERAPGEIDLGEAVWSAGSGRGSEVVISLRTHAVALDVATGAVRELGERCGAASAIEARDAGVACVVGERGDLRWLEPAGERTIEPLGHVRFEGGRVVGLSDAGVVTIGSDGARRVHAAPGAEELLDVRGGRALIARRDGVALVDLESGAAPEVVLDERAHGGVLGEDIVLATDRGALVWLRRGAQPRAPAWRVRVPEGFVELEPIVEGDWPAWGRNGARWERARDDVAAFEWDGEDGFAHAVVSRIDRGELRRFEGDDAGWARALMSRYVERGSERWGRVYRDATGARVMRGHTYIGGCERTHVDVRVRELEDALELTTMHTAEREHVDEVLGAIPARARAIDDGLGEEYAGDPSIGELE